MPGDGGWDGSIDAHLLSDVDDDDHDDDDDYGDDDDDNDDNYDEDCGDMMTFFT